MKSILKISVKPNTKISEAILKLRKTGDQCLLVVDKNLNLLGTLTDGDLRLPIVRGINLNNSIEKFYNKKPKTLKEKDLNNKILVTELFTKYGINIIPVVNKKKLIKIITWSDFFSKKEGPKPDFDLVIMAGGKGTRLLPFTKVLPKPLIPINDKPIISHILNFFKKGNLKNTWITVNFKSNILKSYLNSTEKRIKIEYINEKKPLGTIGSVGLIPEKKISKNFIVTNCDILLDEPLNKILEYHNNQQSDMTVVVVKKKYKIPYGTCVIGAKGNFLKLVEKPEYSFFVNTGFYIMNKRLIKFIQKNKYQDINEFINKIKKLNKKINCYPITEKSWKDFGQWEEYFNETKN